MTTKRKRSPAKKKAPEKKRTPSRKKASTKATTPAKVNPTKPTGLIKEATKDAREQAWEAICVRVTAAIGEDSPIRFSAYKRGRGGIPVDNLDKVAIRGRLFIVAKANPHWGGEESQAYRSEVVERPTWLDLCKLAHQQIQVTGDRHHVFLEGFERVGFAKRGDFRIPNYELLLGS